MSSITLHKTKGVNPYLTFCPRCGGEASELILVGSRDSIFECCGITLIGGGPCPKCKSSLNAKFVRKLEDHERLPAREPCDKCKAELENFKKEVEAGGVFFFCEDCHCEGVIKASAPMAAEVRKTMNIEPPKPCGIKFDKNTCPNPSCRQKGQNGISTDAQPK